MTEAQIQRAVIDLLTKAGVFCFPVPNNPRGRRTVGFKAGIPDVWAVHDGKVFALELKTEKGGVVSEQQLAAVSSINEAGGFAAVANGLDKAIAICQAWGLLRKPYNAQDDFAKSLDEGYRVIKERVAAGGPGWKRKV